MPVRKPFTRYGRNIVGKFPSLKLDRMVAFESRIERDQIYLMEYDPNVVFFEEQPFSIDYKYGGKELKYTPDFRVVDANGRHRLIECKPQKYVNKDDNQRKFAVAKEWCLHRNWEYKVITDNDTRSGFRLQNVMMLWQFARHHVSVALKARIYGVLNSENPLTVDELAARFDPDNPRTAVISIFHMLFHHELFTLIDQAKITGNLPIYLSQDKEVVS